MFGDKGYEFEVCSDGSATAQALAWATGNLQNTLIAALEHDLVSKHSTVLHEGEEELNVDEEMPNDADQGRKVGTCISAGMCVCTGEGLTLLRFRNRFTNQLKRCFPFRSPLRKALFDGMHVVKLSGKLQAEDEDEDHEAENASLKEVWVHVGLLYCSPWVPSFQMVEPTDDPHELPLDPRRQYIKGLGVFLKEYQLHSQLDRELCWSM